MGTKPATYLKKLSKINESIRKCIGVWNRQRRGGLGSRDVLLSDLVATKSVTILDNETAQHIAEELETEFLETLFSIKIQKLYDGYASSIADVLSSIYYEVSYVNELINEISPDFIQPKDMFMPSTITKVDSLGLSEIDSSNVKCLIEMSQTLFVGRKTIINTLRKFAPGLLERRTMSIKRRLGISPIAPAQPAPQPQEPGVKLQWNGTSDSLYDLIAQLSLQSVNPTKPLLGNTIEGLAKFLADHVEGMPSVGTIERRIREFRDPQAQKPKRNRIELYINKEKL